MTAPLFSWLLGATIKGSIVVLLVFAVHRLIGNHLHARWRHALWLLVLLRLAIPFAPEARWSIFNLIPAQEAPMPPLRARLLPAPAAPSSRAAMEVFEARTAATPMVSVRTARWALAIWLIGAALLALRTILASLRTHFAVRRAFRTGGANGRLQEVLDDAKQRLGVTRAVRIIECDVVKTPALHGLFRPTILLPAGLAESFSREELRHVLLHELWHLRRLDVGVSWAVSAVQTLHWFNPLVWFAASRIKEERELACDELALSCLEEDERLGYGTTILKLLERFRAAAPVPALIGIVNHKQKMKRRLTMIASFRNRTRFPFLFLAAAFAIAAVGLTDANGGERRQFMHKLDPAAEATVEKLHERVSFELTNATLSELLSAVSNETGVPVVQSAEIASLDVQQARFTVRAENVPANAVLMEALESFGVMPKPDPKGVTIVQGRAFFVHRAEAPAEGAGKMEKFEHVIITDGDPAEARKAIEELEGRAPRGTAERDVIVKKFNHEASKAGADGVIKRELTMKYDENGVSSEGKLTLEIATK